jgi:hypothetical protein
MEVKEQSRRDFVKRLAYVTPVVVTLLAAPSTARAGSGAPAARAVEPGQGGDLRRA